MAPTMSAVSNKKKKLIEQNYQRLSLEELVRRTGLAPPAIKAVIAGCSAQEKIQAAGSLHGAEASAKMAWAVTVTALLVFACTVAVYLPALNNDFVWDDVKFITENQLIRSLRMQSLAEMVFSFRVGSWHPLTWISHAVDYHFWGSNPSGHHGTSIVIHAFNAVLVFYLSLLLLARAGEHGVTGRWITGSYRRFAAGITALLFGLHPVHVESVAWVAERKDLLCAFFVFLSLLSYLSYAASASKVRYTLAFLFFIAALMSKPMAVTLPIMLLLCDFYPLRRIQQPLAPVARHLPVLLEKIPFLALSCVSVAVTIAAQGSGGALKSLERFPFPLRLLNALRTPGFYLETMLLPERLVPLYPFPGQHEWQQAGFLLNAAAVVAITVLTLVLLRRGKRFLFTAWTWYLVGLLPVLGIVQVGVQAAADRYTYLPSVSIFLLAGVGAAWLLHKSAAAAGRAGAWLLMTMFLLGMLSLGWLTVRQIEVWRNSEVLWEYVTRSFPFPRSDAMVHNNLGAAYYGNGAWDKAIEEYKKAISLRPRYADAQSNLGAAYARKGLIDEAIAAHKAAIAVKPDSPRAHLNLGVSYSRKGELDKAIEEFKAVVALDADYATAHTYLAVAYYKQGNYRLAIEHCDRAAQLQGSADEDLLRLLAPYRGAAGTIKGIKQ